MGGRIVAGFSLLLSICVLVSSERTSRQSVDGNLTCTSRNTDSAVRRRRGQSCSKACVDDRDCLNRQCRCDGACGLSCVSASRSCPWPVRVDNAIVKLAQGPRPVFGHWLKITCKTGFKAWLGPAVSRHRCQGDRRWSGRMPVCVVEAKSIGPCGKPPDVTKGFYEGLQRSGGRTVQYNCNPGFRLHGTESNTCQDNGTWTNTAPTCRPIYCRRPPEIDDGVLVAMEKARYRVREHIYYLCRKGYLLDGSNKVTCTAKGLWSSKPKCQASCKILPHRSQVLYKGEKLWPSVLPGARVKHQDEVDFYCVDKRRSCSYPVTSQCLNGQLRVPACYKEPSWVRFTLFPWRVASEMDECREERQ